MHACVLSCFSHVWLFVTLWTVTQQAPLSMGFSMQEYWSGLPRPLPGDLPQPRDQTHVSCSSGNAGRLLTAEPPGSPSIIHIQSKLNRANTITWPSTSGEFFLLAFFSFLLSSSSLLPIFCPAFFFLFCLALPSLFHLCTTSFQLLCSHNLS